MMAMQRWNVLVSIREGGFRTAVERLRRYGTVYKTPYYNLLAVDTEDSDRLLEALKDEQESQPESLQWLSEVAAVRDGFLFHSRQEFQRKAREHLRPLLGELSGKRFVVRMHRHGFEEQFAGASEAQQLNRFLLDSLDARGEQAAIDPEDPDVIIDIEMLAQEAGIGLWSRRQRQRYPFLKSR